MLGSLLYETGQPMLAWKANVKTNMVMDVFLGNSRNINLKLMNLKEKLSRPQRKKRTCVFKVDFLRNCNFENM